ncbi:MAG: hypothetical protein QM706_08965 [Nitrospira sp.]
MGSFLWDIDTSTVANFALPLKLIEYACLGMPAITVRNAAIEHYFHPDECMFFNSGDSEALALMIDNVTEKRDCLAEYRNKLAKVRGRLSWRDEKNKYIATLRSLADQSESAAIFGKPEP